MKYLKVGNIVEIEWTDVQGYSRLDFDDIEAIEDPPPTHTWGVVIKVLPKSVIIAHELSDLTTDDGCYASIYPFKVIDAVKVLGKVK
jgi:hypothetical protein